MPELRPGRAARAKCVAMPLHLLKLCVGCDSVKDLDDWIKQRLKQKKKAGEKPEHIHTTRMVPKRADELVDGGSLYWVIKGEILCRERLLAIRPFTDKDGIGRCRLVMDGKVVNHESAWRAGVAGARLGLMIPAKPMVGQKFYQEIAPKVAMDRVEVVSIDETVKTPAGVFEHCVHLRETTPLERDVSHKYYAPGIGIIKDDEFELAER